MSLFLDNFVVADRIRQTTVTTGTGDITFSGTYPAYRPFSDFMSVGYHTFYCISDVGNDDYELGIGKYKTGGVLERLIVFKSSNADALVTLAAGTKEIFCCTPASIMDHFHTMSGEDFILKGFRRFIGGGIENRTVSGGTLSVFSFYNNVTGGEVTVNTIYSNVATSITDEFLLVKCSADGITFTNAGNIVTPTGENYTIVEGEHALLYYNGTKWNILFTSRALSSYYVHNSGNFFHTPDNCHGVLVDMAAVNDNVLLALPTNVGAYEQTVKLTSTAARKVLTLNNSGSGDASGRKLYLANDYITYRFQDGDDGWIINEFIAKHIAIATRASNQAITQNTVTIVDLTTTVTDNAGNVDLSANTITPLKSAFYRIYGQVKFDTVASGVKVNAYIYVNGVQVHESQGYADTGSIILDINMIHALVAGDTVTLRVRHNDSTSRNLASARFEVIDQGL